MLPVNWAGLRHQSSSHSYSFWVAAALEALPDPGQRSPEPGKVSPRMNPSLSLLGDYGEAQEHLCFGKEPRAACDAG